MRRRRARFGRGLFQVLTFASLLLFAALPAASQSAPASASSWEDDWEVMSGLALERDAGGFDMPTALAFVPEPGPGPKDPLYFVTELRGAVKVVTNDRTIETFAEDFPRFVPDRELPDGQGQGGMAGICLDPERGYVFVTFIYQDEAGILRNNIVRFTTIPGTFTGEPAARIDFSETFAPYEGGITHQIGGCRVRDGILYVGVGDGWQPTRVQELDVTNGKMLRMTVDGEPLPDNPFYESGERAEIRNYVFAYGLRNPFGLDFIEDRLFVAENGLKIDRFVEIERGMNYLWDGTDESIAGNAEYVWIPAMSPVQMEYVGEASYLADERLDRFYIAMAGDMYYHEKKPKIVSLPFDVSGNRVTEVPQDVLRYRGEEIQMITGLASGPDGLYFTTLFETGAGPASVYRMREARAASEAHPYATTGGADGQALLRAKGCVGCHAVNGGFALGGGGVGPTLGADLVPRLRERLHSEAYEEQVKAVDRLATEPQASHAAARREVLDAEGVERVRTWIEHFVREPRFDREYTTMPNLGVTEAEAVAIASYLTRDRDDDGAGTDGGFLGTAVSKIRSVGLRRTGAIFAAGFLACGVLLFAGRLVLRRRTTS
jgi:mono/diheme cytochrome c family protein